VEHFFWGFSFFWAPILVLVSGNGDKTFVLFLRVFFHRTLPGGPLRKQKKTGQRRRGPLRFLFQQNQSIGKKGFTTFDSPCYAEKKKKRRNSRVRGGAGVFVVGLWKKDGARFWETKNGGFRVLFVMGARSGGGGGWGEKGKKILKPKGEFWVFRGRILGGMGGRWGGGKGVGGARGAPGSRKKSPTFAWIRFFPDFELLGQEKIGGGQNEGARGNWCFFFVAPKRGNGKISRFLEILLRWHPWGERFQP